MERTEILSLPIKTVEDLIAVHLYAMGKLDDNEDVKVTIGEVPEGATAMFLELKISKEVKVNN